MNKLFFALCAATLVFSSCLRLDPFMYSNTPIDAYLLDDYKDGEITSEERFAIDDSMVHHLQLVSDDDGNVATIHAFYIGDINRIATDTVLLYCHGNAGNIDNYWNRAKLLANLGTKNRFGVLIMDYRGFGMSEGEPTENGLYADVDACMIWLKDKGLTNDRLVIYGFSLGTAPATELSAYPRTLTPSKLILEAPFASTQTMTDDASGIHLPATNFTNNKVNNADKIKDVKQPLCWFHGIDDDFLSIKTHGEVVYKNYVGPYKEAHRVEGAGHSDLPFVMGYDTYSAAVLDFIIRN